MQPSLSSNTREKSNLPSPFVRGFLKRVQNTVTTYSLWGQKESFIVAVSGGPDSICLLDILFLLSKKYDFTLHVAHVNYALRGKDSDLDETLVKERATAYGLSFSVLHPKKISSSNMEESLRDIRYRFFEKLRVEKKATLIAIAHHEDDQAETFLLRLLRGSGMKGLSSMRPKNNFIVRPLIEMSRLDILRYLDERALTFRIDESNTDPKFFRNRVRHELMPLLEKEFQPGIKKLLADTAFLLAEDYALIESLVAPLAEVPHTPTNQFSCQKMRLYPEVLQRHLLRHLLQPWCHNKSASKSLIEECLKMIKSTKSKTQIITVLDLKIERKGDTVRLLNFSH